MGDHAHNVEGCEVFLSFAAVSATNARSLSPKSKGAVAHSRARPVRSSHDNNQKTRARARARGTSSAMLWQRPSKSCRPKPTPPPCPQEPLMLPMLAPRIPKEKRSLDDAPLVPARPRIMSISGSGLQACVAYGGICRPQNGKVRGPKNEHHRVYFLTFAEGTLLMLFWGASATPKDPHKSAHHEHQRVGSRVLYAAAENTVNTVVFVLLRVAKARASVQGQRLELCGVGGWMGRGGGGGGWGGGKEVSPPQTHPTP